MTHINHQMTYQEQAYMMGSVFPNGNTKYNNTKIKNDDENALEKETSKISKHFAEITAIHGIGHIPQRSKICGAIWTVICLASFGKCAYIL